MRWVLRVKRETNAAEIDVVPPATGDRPFVEVSTRDAWWGARPVADRYEGRNDLRRLCMELRHHLRHSFTSRALALGESLSMIGKLLGHNKIDTTARYAHLARDSIKASSPRVADSIGADILDRTPRDTEPA